MYKILTIAFLFQCVHFVSNAQSYFDETSVWKSSFGGAYGWENKFAYFDGDTTIDGKVYLLMFRNTFGESWSDPELYINEYSSIHIPIGKWRQQGDSVFYYSDAQGEILSQRYNWQVGDTIHSIQPTCSFNYIVSEVDSFFFNGAYRKRFYTQYADITLVEGIGNWWTGISPFYCVNPGSVGIEVSFVHYTCYSQQGETYALYSGNTCLLDMPVDTIPPWIACSSNLGESFINYDFCQGLPNYLSQLLITDDQDTNLEITQYPLPGTLISENTVITITARDDLWNISTCEFTQIFYDNISPIIQCPSNVDVVIPIGETSTLFELSSAIAQDNCGIASIWNSVNGEIDASGFYDVGLHLLIFYTSDLNGNVSTCTTEVLVSVDTPPVVYCPGIAIPILAPTQCFPTFDYGCVDDYIDDVIIMDESGNIQMSHLNTWCNSIGWTDDNGNLITQFDSIPGTTTCNLTSGESYSLICNSFAAIPEYFGFWIDFNNDGDFNDSNEWIGNSSQVLVQYSFLFTIPNIGVSPGPHRFRIIASYSMPLSQYDMCISDNWGETHDYIIHINNSPLSTNCSVVPNLTSSVMVVDNLDAAPIVTQWPEPGVFFSDSLTMVITATDNLGSVGSCAFVIYPNDDVPPQVICPESFEVISFVNDGAIIEVALPIAEDNCGSFSISNNYNNNAAAADFYPSGIYVVTYFVTDFYGNQSSCDVSITIPNVEQNFCPSDINNDSIIDMNDFLILIAEFGCVENCSADIDGDGIVGASDVQVMLWSMDQECP